PEERKAAQRTTSMAWSGARGRLQRICSRATRWRWKAMAGSRSADRTHRAVQPTVVHVAAGHEVQPDSVQHALMLPARPGGRATAVRAEPRARPRCRLRIADA